MQTEGSNALSTRGDAVSKVSNCRLIERKPSSSTIFAIRTCTALVLGLMTLVCAAQPSPTSQEEIGNLLDSVGKSQCEFYRNGQWQGTSVAQAHLQRKYDYLLRKGMVSTAEEFIERAGSASSISGTPYQIRCGAGKAVPSAQWLSAQLHAYRQGTTGKQNR